MAAINSAFVGDEDEFREARRQRDESYPQPPPPPPPAPGPGPAVSRAATTESKNCFKEVDYSKARRWPQISAALPAIFGAFVLGTTLGWCSPVQPQLRRNATAYDAAADEDDVWQLSLNDDQMSWVGSLINGGALIGSVCGGVLMDRFGRKVILLAVFVAYTLGWALITLAIDPGMLYMGRIVGGLAGGVCCVVAPSYIGETATPSMRGSLGMLFSGMISAGILASSLLGWLDWRWISAVSGVQPLLFLAGVVFVPDSPYFLVKQGRDEEARKSLVWLRGSEFNVDAELAQIEARVHDELSQPDFKMSDLWRPKLYKPLLVGIGLMVFQQFSGINAALFNSVDIFRLAGSSLDGLVSSVILNLVLMVAALSSSILVERLGRRILFLISEVLTCFFVVVMGVYFYILDNDADTARSMGWFPLTCLICFIAVFAIGVGPLPWLVSSEVMPARFKGPGGSVVAFTNWATSFVVTKIFLDMQRSLTNAGTFWVFGAFCFVGILFGVFVLPETKGRTPEQIAAFFDKSASSSSTGEFAEKPEADIKA